MSRRAIVVLHDREDLGRRARQDPVRGPLAGPIHSGYRNVSQYEAVATGSIRRGASGLLWLLTPMTAAASPWPPAILRPGQVTSKSRA
jgi:hypothetical protein